MSPMEALTDPDGKPLWLLQTGEQFLSLVLELAIFRRPLRVERRVEHLLQLGSRFSRPIIVDQQLGEEEVRGGAVVACTSATSRRCCSASLWLPPEQTRHLEIPASQRAIRRSLLKRGIEAQHGVQLVLDWPAVLDALPETERFGERSHVGRHPEMSLGPIGLQRRSPASAVDALLEDLAPLSLAARGRRASNRRARASTPPRRRRAARGEFAVQMSAACRALARFERSA